MKRNNTNDFRQRTIAELLKSITKQELRHLTNYLKTHCTPGTLQLWLLLKTKHPKFDITDEYIRDNTRPNKPLSDKHYRYQLADLSKHTKAFIAEQEFRNNKLQYANSLANALMKRNAVLNYKKIRQQNEQLFTKERKPDANQYHYLQEYHSIDFQFNTVNQPNKVSNSLQLASDNHDYSFLINKLRWIIAMQNRSRVVKKTFNDQHEKAFIDYLTNFSLDELPLIKAYYLALLQFQQNTYEQFVSYKEHVLSIRHQFDRDEMRQLLTLAGNFCVLNIQEGKLEFLEERFMITKINVEEGFLNVLNYFSNNHFLITLRDAVEAEQLSWAYDFLKTKLPETHPDHQINLELLGWAIWYFAKGDYEKQEEYMVEMQSTDYKFYDFYNELAYKVLQLKTDYILLGNKPAGLSAAGRPKKLVKEVFKSRLSSYLLYLRRKENLLESIRDSRINFGKALRLIYNKRYGTQRIDKDLETEILALKPITELPWLLKELG